MKRLLAAGAVVLALLTVGACGGSGDDLIYHSDPPKTSVGASSPSPYYDPSSVDPALKRQLFLQTVRSGEYGPQFSSISDDVLVELVQSTCDALDRGATATQLSEAGINSGFTPQQVGWVLGAGVAAYCPEYNDVIGSF